MNTLTITVGRFTPLNADDKPTILIVARDQYAETTLSFENAVDAVNCLPTEFHLVDAVMAQPGFEDLTLKDGGDDPYSTELEDAFLVIEGYKELHKEISQ